MVNVIGAVNGGHTGNNQDLSITGVIGTLGTADTSGTALPLPIAVDPATGAVYVNILAGAGAASNPTAGTLNTLGTVGTIIGIGGTVQVSGASAGTNVNIVTGSQQTLGTVGTVLGIGGVVQINQATGTINVGTVVNNGGSVQLTDNVNIANIVNLGTGELGSAFQSSVKVAGGYREFNGSVTSATVLLASTDLSSFRWVSIQLLNTWVGTVALQASNDNSNFFNQGVISIQNTANALGTLMTANSIYVSPLNARYYRLNVPSYTSGTVQAIMEAYSTPAALQTMGVTASQNGGYNVALTSSNGTILNLANGTFSTGTFVNNGGTVQSDMRPVNVGTSINVIGTTGAAVWGTVVSSPGNGIKNYVAGVDIVVTTGTVDIAVTQIGIGGSTGAGVLARGQFIQGGGIAKSFLPLQVSGTGGTISYWMGGAGTASITVQYAQGA